MSDESTMVPIYATFQLFAVLITAATLVFYVSQLRNGNKGDWEPIYVSGVEFIAYLMALVLPDGYAFRSFQDDAGIITVPVFRYVSWLATCPIILKVLVTVISHEDNIDQDVILRLMLLITWIELLGFMGSMYVGMLKIFFIALAVILCIYMYYIICTTWNKNHHKSLLLSYPKERFELMALLMVSWILFPILYIVGPECFGLISNQFSIIGHVIGDIISKNLWGLMAWKLRLKIKDGQPMEQVNPLKTVSNDGTNTMENYPLDKIIQTWKGREYDRESIYENGPSSPKTPSETPPETTSETPPKTPPNKMHFHNLLEHYMKTRETAYNERKDADIPGGDLPFQQARSPNSPLQEEGIKQSSVNEFA